MEQLCLGCMKQKTRSPKCEHCGYDDRSSNLPHQLPVGTLLQNQYLVGRVLGQGGFGITYIGWDQNLSQPVAIKEYYPSGMVQRNCAWGLHVTCGNGESPQLFERHQTRFLREARTLAQLDGNSEIVQVRNYFSENGTAYIVMEYVEGITMKDYLKRLGRPMTPQEALFLMDPVLVALGHVHDRQLIHRDISPDNIMLPAKGGIKLIDFGTVRHMDGSNSKSTESVLKPGFAPLEQYNTRGNLGPWTDIYAICATLHYLMTGKLPPDAPSRIEEGDALPLLEKIPGISPALVYALKKGMAIRAADRVQTVEELRTLLHSAELPKDEAATGPRRKASPVRWVAAACGALVLTGAVLWFLLGGSSEDPQLAVPEETALPAVTEQTQPDLPSEMPAEQSTDPLQPETEAEPAWVGNVLASFEPNPAPNFTRTVVPGSTIPRSQVTHISVLDHIPEKEEPHWDVSEYGKGTVIAWVEGNSGAYHLYFAAEGGINAKGDACVKFFYGYSNLISLSLNGAFHTDYAEDMSFMFKECKSLKELDLSSLNTEKVWSMWAMFSECESLRDLDLSGLDTGNVTTMDGMFYGCIDLSKLDVSSFDTGNVTDMHDMFAHCTSLRDLDMTGFDTSNVKDMSNMFFNCWVLAELDLSGFDTGNVSTMNSMFSGCGELRVLNLDGWDTSWAKDMGGMFRDCESLRELNLTHFDTSRVTDMSEMFSGCTSLRTLELGQWETENASSIHSFYPTNNLPDGTKWTELFWE